MKFSIAQIREAGVKGEINHIDVDHLIDTLHQIHNKRERLTDDYFYRNGFSVFGYDMFIHEVFNLKIRKVTTNSGKHFYTNLGTNKKLFFTDEVFNNHFKQSKDHG